MYRFSIFIAAQCARATPCAPFDKLLKDVARIVALVDTRPADIRPLARLCAVYGAGVETRGGRLALVWADPRAVAYPPPTRDPVRPPCDLAPTTGAPRKTPRLAATSRSVKHRPPA